MKKFYSLLLFILFAQLLVAQEDCSGISGNINPSSATICEGQSVLLTVSGGSSYEWQLDGVTINGETGNTLNATQSGTYSATIIEGTCSVPASNTSTVTVTPTPTGTISPASASVCAGSSVVLTATGGSSYTWFLNGNEINGENNATIDASDPGTYSVTIHNGDCSGNASNTAVVSAASNPTGTISPSSGSICAGSSIVLTATGGSSYTWFRNGNEINGETDATLSVNQAGTYSVTIHQGNCSGNASNTSVITSASAPTGNISPASTSICPGSSVILTATGGTSYTWFRNGNQINGENDATLSVNQLGTYSVTIHQGNCSGPASNTSEVTAAAEPTGDISPATASVCAGSSVVLTATGGTTYTWFRNGNRINGQTNETLNVTQSGTYSVTIHQGSCSGAASNTSEVTVTPAPTGNISPGNTSICLGSSQVLTATGGTSYTWFLNGVEIMGETAETITVTQPGIYTATIHDGDCSGPASNTAFVTILPIPIGTLSPASGTICQGGSLAIIATGGSSYTWFRDGTEIPGETRSTLNVSDPGTYSAIIRQGTCSGPALNTSVISIASAPTGTISPANGSICQGSSLVLTATGGTSYTWFRNGNRINGETDATLNVTQAGTYTVTIIQGDCSGPGSNSSIITLADAPTGAITPSTAAICQGGSVLLTTSGGTSYIWYRNGSLLQGENGSTLTASLAGTYSVTINQGDCSGPASNTAVVTNASAPTGNINPATAAICGGGSQVLTATGGTAYTWSRDGVVIDGEESATITVTQAGTYSVVIKNGSCTGAASNTAVVTTENLSSTRYPEVNTRPNIPAQLSAREIGTSYEWTPPDGLSNPTSPSPTVTTQTNRDYIVKITTASGCMISDSVLVKVKTVLFVPTAFTPNGNGVNDSLRPFGELRSLEFFRVYNRWGQLLFETKDPAVGWDGKYKGADQASDTYTWLMLGTGQDGQPVKLSGKTLLIR